MVDLRFLLHNALSSFLFLIVRRCLFLFGVFGVVRRREERGTQTFNAAKGLLETLEGDDDLLKGPILDDVASVNVALAKRTLELHT